MTIRCLVAKVGLDGHDRGAHVVAQSFRDAGFEVIYSGLHNEPEDVVEAAVQEDVDVVGLSLLSGAHNTLVPDVIQGLEDYGVLEDVLVILGGTIPEPEQADLLERGVDRIFGPGTDTAEAVEFIRTELGDDDDEEPADGS